ncbi:leucine-rich repeat domain-containing protein [Fulvivirga sediminis]|uniref:Leucine-rich repeat domain-containing protein n=1 Tax=Fulvivirga sediminis TaxID=2803949 RepID=A0A937FAY4_9BACT|nr:leucine-rich repeat domain-containing protein [Fulvivirga sediminis]MBL3657499.1 leucine-rich repeat domain-containing protein [Fulvivirga sediminis]
MIKRIFIALVVLGLGMMQPVKATDASHLLSSEGYIPVDPKDSTVLANFQEALTQIGWPTFYDINSPARSWAAVTWSSIQDGGYATSFSLNGNNSAFKTDSLTDLIIGLKELDHLQSLDIGEIGLRYITPQISVLTQLRSLSFGFNELEELPVEISALKELEELFLNSNQFSDIPDLSALPKLKILNMNRNPLTGDYNIPTIESLEYLGLQLCKLTRLPESISQVPNLIELVLSYNYNLRVFPESISQLSKLEVLRLNEGALEELPSGVDGLTSLRFFDISYNKLKNLPASLSSLNSLEVIRFQSNEIESFPLSIAGLPNLKEINGSRNKMTGGIPSELFTRSDLRVDLSFNMLSGVISTSADKPMPTLFFINNNSFTLKDINPIYQRLKNSNTNFKFNPQNLVGEKEKVIPDAGSELTLSISGYTPLGGADVKWYKTPRLIYNGAPTFVGSVLPLLIDSFNPLQDKGIYYAVITHPSLSGLQLESERIRVVGDNEAPKIQVDNLIVFRNDSVPEFTFSVSDDFTFLEDLIVSISDSPYLEFEVTSEDPVIRKRKIILNDPNWVGVDTVTFTVTDEEGAYTQEDVIIKVADSENSAPIIKEISPIYLKFDGSFDNGSEGPCSMTYVYSSTTFLSPFVADDFDIIDNLYFSLDPSDSAEFANNDNFYIDISQFGSNKQLNVLVFACEDTTLNRTINMVVKDKDGAKSTAPVTLIYDSAGPNMPPVVKTISEQRMVKGAPRFADLDLSDYVKDDYLNVTDLKFELGSVSSFNIEFIERAGSTYLRAQPEFPDSSYTQKVDFYVFESTNQSSYASFSITFAVIETGFIISGLAIDENNIPLSAVEIQGFTEDVFTDADGKYSVEVIPGWSGTLTPMLADYTFSPEQIVFENIQADSTLKDFIGTYVGEYMISGTISFASNEVGVEGVVLDGLINEDVITDQNGYYEFSVPKGWSGTITPMLSGYTFTPSSMTYKEVNENWNFQSYIAEEVTGVDDIDVTPFSFLPNPASKSVSIYFKRESISSGSALFYIYDLEGRELKKFELSPETEFLIWDGSLDCGNRVDSGMYVGELYNGDEVFQLKLLWIY